MNKSNQERAKILLKAARDILIKCEKSPVVADVFTETAIWDDVECDGSCLLDELKELVNEIENEENED